MNIIIIIILFSLIYCLLLIDDTTKLSKPENPKEEKAWTPIKIKRAPPKLIPVYDRFHSKLPMSKAIVRSYLHFLHL